VQVGAWVLERALRQARRCVDQLGLDDFTLAVNLSPRQLAAPDLVTHVDRLLRHHGWAPERLTLELTERVLIDEADGSSGVLDQLKRLGVRVAIDDFGTGYSSLRYLHRFPIDIVKVDRSFVTGLRADGRGSPVATAVMDMAHAFGLLAAAEGVEQRHQLDGLRALGCDWAQGFLFAEALTPAELVDLLRADPRW
jgi:EAL domain-containing protein (putative c-di-GMP-specific phosphodiesterase class I)